MSADELMVEALSWARREIEQLRNAAHEPIAIIGMGVRLPADMESPDAFWNSLALGVDAVRGVPAERWTADEYYDANPDSPDRMYVRGASFLTSSPALFDADYFGISALEARGMDPQHRMLLEVGTAALEDAGVLGAERMTGVFVGLMGSEYRALGAGRATDDLTAYFELGTAEFAAANRISYHLGLNGPSMTIGAACASSLMAVHHACQALRAEDCAVALAGGVNVITDPHSMVAASKLRAYSPDGRSKAFDASADGYGRGEGCGMVVLRRLSDALREGDRIYAVIRGTASNHVGQTSGFTVPSSATQAQLIKEALRRAGTSPSDVQYVEAHGTGTVLGDPIEVEALSEVFGGAHSPEAPLKIGSVKTNIGHLEAAAGVSALAKVVLSIRRRQLPPSLHFSTPNPHIPWDDIQIQVQEELSPWPAPDKPLVAGVSSFGLSGANVHAVVAEPPSDPAASWAEADAVAAEKRAVVLAVSAKTEAGAREQVQKFLQLLSASDREATYRDIAYTSSVRRTHYAHRVAVVGRSVEQLRAGLEAHLSGSFRLGVAAAHVVSPRKRLAFVFSGQGRQWAGMGLKLSVHPRFRETLEAVDAELRRHSELSVLEELARPAESSRLSNTRVAQPALFALQVALTAQLAEWGVTPFGVAGHSVGEIAAAHAAGVLSLQDACRIVSKRGVVMERATGQGRMAAVSLPSSQVEERLAKLSKGGNAQLVVAAENGPADIVVSGPAEALAAFVKDLERDGTVVKDLGVDYAFHSPGMEPFGLELARSLDGLRAGAAQTRIYSTVTGDEDGRFDAAYWGKQMYAPVRLQQAVTGLMRAGADGILEVGPHAALVLAMSETTKALSGSSGAIVVGTLRRDTDDEEALSASLAGLHCAGYAIDWRKYHGVRGRVVSLPEYPWQRQRYWVDANRKNGARRSLPFVDRHMASSDRPGTHLFEVEVDLADSSHAYLADHKVQGKVWMPAAAFAEMALEAAGVMFPGRRASVEGLQLVESLTLSEGEPMLVQLVVDAAQEGTAAFRIASRPGKQAATEWTAHATGQLGIDRDGTASSAAPLTELQKRCSRAVDVPALYEGFEAVGTSYGPAFRGVERAWRGDNEALTALTPLDGLGVHRGAHTVHPSLLDGALQSAALAVELERGRSYVPASIESLRVLDKGTPRWAHVMAKPVTKDGAESDIALLDEAGRVVVQIEGLRLAPTRVANDGNADSVFEVAWRASASTTAEAATGRWLLLADEGGVAHALGDALTSRGAQVVTISPGREFATRDATHYEADILDATQLRRAMNAAFAGSAPRRIVHLSGLDTRATPQAVLDADVMRRAEDVTCASALHLTQAIREMEWSEAPRLFFVTRACQAAKHARDVLFPEQALLWGFAGSIAHEMSELEPTLIDIEPATSADTLARSLAAADDENRVALRGGERFVERLVHHDATARGSQRSRLGGGRIAADKAYLITGGLGGLGLVVAARLAKLGARHLVLMGRSEPSESARAAIGELEREGVRVHVARADVAKVDDVRQALAQRGDRAPAIDGIIHAAGWLDDATLPNLTADRIHAVLAPKTLGALALDSLFPRAALRVYFSSAAGVMGSAAQAHYAAGNAFLDALAHRHVAESRHALSLDWGAWSEVGMASRADRRGSLGRQGLASLTPAEGADLFERLLFSSSAQLVPFPIDLDTWRKANARLAALPLLRELGAKAVERKESAVLARLRTATSDADRLQVIETYLQTTVATATQTSPDSVARTAAFKDVGVDSLMAVSMKNTIERDLAVRIPTAALFSHPSVEGLASYLAKKVGTSRPSKQAGEPPPPAQAAPAESAAAVPATDIEALSDAEVSAQLAARLQRLGGSGGQGNG